MDTRRTISGRNRWSSYELVGAAGLSLAAEQAADVDDDMPKPMRTDAVENGQAVRQTRSADTVSTSRATLDVDYSQNNTQDVKPGTSATAKKDSTPKDRRKSHNDEILGRYNICFHCDIRQRS